MIAFWVLIGGLCAALTAFAGIFALAFWVTGGSAWMLAFFPAFVAVPTAVAAPIVRISLRMVNL